MKLAPVFLEHLGAERAKESGLDVRALEARLAELVAQATSCWPDIDIAPATFATYLAERVPDALPLSQALDELQTNALFLACACAAGNERALATFETEFGPTIGQALRGLDKSGALTDDATQILRQRLFVAEPDRVAKICDYRGQGDLRRWVRAAATRIGLDRMRVDKREAARKEDDQVLAALPDSSSDPALAHFHAHYGAELKKSFESALSSLPGKQLTVLRYHYVDGLTIDEIGSLYDVHRTTAFRWIERARETLVAETRSGLQKRIGINPNDINSVMKLVQSNLNLSLNRLLKIDKN